MSLDIFLKPTGLRASMPAFYETIVCTQCKVSFYSPPENGPSSYWAPSRSVEYCECNVGHFIVPLTAVPANSLLKRVHTLATGSISTQLAFAVAEHGQESRARAPACFRGFSLGRADSSCASVSFPGWCATGSGSPSLRETMRGLEPAA